MIKVHGAYVSFVDQSQCISLMCFINSMLCYSIYRDFDNMLFGLMKLPDESWEC